MRALVTGSTGFVGRHLTALLESKGHEVVRCTRAQFEGSEPLDLRGVRALFHLAAQSFVPEAVASPMATYEANVMGTARLARAVARHTAESGERLRFIFASSAEVYGVVRSDMLPLFETTCTNPRNPYAASKAAAESVLIAEYNSFDLDVVIARAFNAIGIGQRSQFAIPNFALQLVQVARGAPARIAVGNLEAQRDFLDVSDVAAAYLALAEHGSKGETYNICSGIARNIRSLLDELIEIANVKIEIVEDPSRMRPSDSPVVIGSNAKIRRDTGWSARLDISTSLRNVFASQVGPLSS